MKNIKYLRKGETEMKELKIRAEFIEELLGSANNDKEIHAEFIASKAPDAPSREEEIEAIGVDAVIEKEKLFFQKMEKEIRFYMIIRLRDFLKMRQKLLIM